MEKIKKSFLRFAQMEARGKSALYESWCLQLIEDEQLLNLVANIPVHQPKPNLFFASVQFLSNKKASRLFRFFQETPNIDFEASFVQLKSFCQEFEQELIELFQTKLVQTNEVNRASYLYPLFSLIYEEANKPLTLIEIGTSAGLLLNVDQYCYEVKQQSQTITYGAVGSPLTIQALNTGIALPKLIRPIVKNRIGIDLNCLDLQNEQDLNWLQALIWPEQRGRLEKLQLATNVQKHSKLQLFSGNFVELLPEILNGPTVNGTQIIIFHTHVANQFSQTLKDELIHILQQASIEQPIYHVYNNMDDADIHMDFIWKRKGTCIKRLSKYDSHGTMFEWNEDTYEIEAWILN